MNTGARLLCTSDGVCVIVYVQFSSAGAGTVWGEGFFSSFWDQVSFGLSRTGEGSSGGRKRGGGVRSGPGAARTILLFHTISARPSKQPRMVGSTLGVSSFGLITAGPSTNVVVYYCRT